VPVRIDTAATHILQVPEIDRFVPDAAVEPEGDFFALFTSLLSTTFL
jgi:hypothetical protein